MQIDNNNNVRHDQICQQLQRIKSIQRGLDDTGAASAPLIAGQNASLGNVPLATPSFEDTDTALRRHSQWRDHFRQLCEYKAQFGDCNVPQPYSANLKLGMWVHGQREKYWKYREEKSTHMTAEYIRALEGIGFDWGTRKTDRFFSWSERFEQLRESQLQFGNCAVSTNYYTNPKLAAWVTTQRQNFKWYQEGKPSSMTAERIRQLESGVGFVWDTSAAFWNERFEQLCKFKVQFGHCAVPIEYSANTKLWHWVRRQRHNYKLHQEGKPSSMPAERIRKLESVGFVWDANAAFWNEQLEQLREFKAQFGHCAVPLRYPANPKLGKWVTVQRRNCKLDKEGKPSPMTVERTRALQTVGFVWDRSAAVWSTRFQELREFKAQFGHCLVPRLYSTNSKLAMWVKNQRCNYDLHQEGKPSDMTAERIRELDSVEFVWDASAAVWNERFRQLCEFKIQFGHCVVPVKYSVNPELGRWVKYQRHSLEKKPSPMTAEHMRALRSVGFVQESRKRCFAELTTSTTE